MTSGDGDIALGSFKVEPVLPRAMQCLYLSRRLVKVPKVKCKQEDEMEFRYPWAREKITTHR